MLPLVWPPPRSLATTSGISVDVFSCPYLDVSVQGVPHLTLFDSDKVDRVLLCRVSPFGNLRINAYVPLPEAFRSLSRPSSAPDAKASALCSFSLDLVNPLRVPHDTRSVIFLLASHFLEIVVKNPLASTEKLSSFSCSILAFNLFFVRCVCCYCSVFKVRPAL